MELKVTTLKQNLRKEFEKKFRDTTQLIVTTIKKVISASHQKLNLDQRDIQMIDQIIDRWQ